MFNWSVFARMIHSTSEFAMTVLSKCVFSIPLRAQLYPITVYGHDTSTFPIWLLSIEFLDA